MLPVFLPIFYLNMLHDSHHIRPVPAVAAVCGNSTGAARLSCLRSLSTDEFMNNITWSIGHGYANSDNGAIIDGVWIANHTVAAARNGQLNRVHYMAGSMLEEGES